MKTLKQKALVAALAGAGVSMFAGYAGAVALSSEGLGETLIYPYYTARGNTQTLMSVVNTTNLGKAVKVRFREAKDSRDVLDFNLFLSPYDVWTGAIFKNVAGDGARLLTNDTSCTAPAKAAWSNLGGGVYSVDFFNYEYQGVAPTSTTTGSGDQSAAHGTDALAGPQSLDRTLDGYVEIIEMATIPTGTALYTAIKHVNGVPPCTATVVPAGAVAMGPTSLGQDVPSGGLFGAVTYVATGAAGMATSVNATALNGFKRTGAISAPNSDQPNLRDHGSCTATVITSTQLIVADMAKGGLCDSSTLGTQNQANAVTAALMASTVSGEYAYTADLLTGTDWVLTMPGKSYYTDRTLATGAPVPPFSNVWSPKAQLASESVSLVSTDREEDRGTTQDCTTDPTRPECTFSPRPPTQSVPGNALNWESSVISFGSGAKATGPSAVLASNNVAWFAGRQNALGGGWLELAFTGANATSLGVSGNTNVNLNITSGVPGAFAAGAPVTFTGLPVIGFAASMAKVTSAPAGQPLNNYDTSVNLVYKRNFK